MGDLSESIKKRKIRDKNIFFSDNIEWGSRNMWKMMSADVKANVKQYNKQIIEVVSVSYIFYFFIRSTFRTWNAM